MLEHPNLTAELARRGIKMTAVAKELGICYKALQNRMNGRTPFTWPEVCILHDAFFPDMKMDELLSKPKRGDRR